MRMEKGKENERGKFKKRKVNGNDEDEVKGWSRKEKVEN